MMEIVQVGNRERCVLEGVCMNDRTLESEKIAFFQ
jgi:hypothetical protein